MYQSLPRLSDYDVSPLNGFLPTEPPCDRLSDPYYAPWERVINNLQALVLTKRLRKEVDSLPVLLTGLLRTEAEWRRAYSILGFIVHAYVWGGDSPADIIPPPISIPFLSTCSHLELPPVATYAGLVLWNWRPIIESEPVDNLENIFTLHTLTGSLDESWFFLVSAAIEARSAPLIPLMLDAISAANYNDQDAVTAALQIFAERLDELGTLLTRMYDNCDPHVFYHRIRPMLAGSKNMADAGLPNGILFDTGSGTDEYVQFSGGSNAQSSIIQFFDIILGVEHRATGIRAGSASNSSASESESVSAERNNFIHEMRRYMPGPHRRFLGHIELIANIRPFVNEHADNAALRTAYDACLAMLRHFRDVHIQMVSRYIILKSRDARSASPKDRAKPDSAVPVTKRMNLAVASTHAANGDASRPEDSFNQQQQQRSRYRKLRGTGGTALIPFLKQARDETGEPAIDAWASRLLNNGPGTVSRHHDSTQHHYQPSKQVGLLNFNSQGARLTKMGEHASGEREILGLAGVWTVDESEGGICHW